ncbi:uncharacterized protein LOC111080764 [Drosophila obscura]|uniref:uncharacterized protein LOC111080764 n=1 Tax=Drosophila obscura TaxID=7282 RepID=UPI001BB2A85E|nr:uncharacterized protein LOC111080764 [Drosophila obscura]
MRLCYFYCGISLFLCLRVEGHDHDSRAEALAQAAKDKKENTAKQQKMIADLWARMVYQLRKDGYPETTKEGAAAGNDDGGTTAAGNDDAATAATTADAGSAATTADAGSAATTAAA